MKLFIPIAVALLVGFGIGKYYGLHIAEQDFARRTVTGVAVDCYDAQGHLVPDTFAAFGGVQVGCAPGQTATVHGAWKPVTEESNTVPVIDAKGFVHEISKEKMQEELTHGGQIDYDALAKRNGAVSKPSSAQNSKR